MNANEPHLEVWKFSNHTWTWVCWSNNCDTHWAPNYGPEYPTHAEALAAALAHCAKAGKR